MFGDLLGINVCVMSFITNNFFVRVITMRRKRKTRDGKDFLTMRDSTCHLLRFTSELGNSSKFTTQITTENNEFLSHDHPAVKESTLPIS